MGALGSDQVYVKDIVTLSESGTKPKASATAPTRLFPMPIPSLPSTTILGINRKDAIVDHFNACKQLEHAFQKKKAQTLHSAPQIPPELECPICHELMGDDPVVAKEGYTYERRAIEDWFDKNIHTGVSADSLLSPFTHMPLADLSLTPNRVVRTMARDFKAQYLDKVGG